MNIELHTFADLPDELQQQFAMAISAETQHQFIAEQKIVPITPRSVLQREIGLVAVQNDLLVGYIGATKVHVEYTQVGTLMVPEHYQGSGIGKQLVARITELVTEADQQPFAFCNPSSQSSFENAGFLPALPGELPPHSQSHFNNQPMIYMGSTNRRDEFELVDAGVLG